MGNCFFDVEGKKETIWTIALLASTLLAEMPELGTRSRSEAALSGLAPYNRETGVHSGRRTLHGGCMQVRRVLSMEALGAAALTRF